MIISALSFLGVRVDTLAITAFVESRREAL